MEEYEKTIIIDLLSKYELENDLTGSPEWEELVTGILNLMK